jgi:hypothetical protein
MTLVLNLIGWWLMKKCGGFVGLVILRSQNGGVLM